jgi:hypothetical protein
VVIFAVIQNDLLNNWLVHFNTTTLCNATAYLAHLLLRDTRPSTHAKAKEPNALATDKLSLFINVQTMKKQLTLIKSYRNQDIQS